MTHYRSKPVVIEAMQFVRGAVFPAWLTDARLAGKVKVHMEIPGGDYMLIDTLEGQMRANENDWIIKGLEDEIYPCKPSVFAAKYEEYDEELETRRAMIEGVHE